MAGIVSLCKVITSTTQLLCRYPSTFDSDYATCLLWYLRRTRPFIRSQKAQKSEQSENLNNSVSFSQELLMRFVLQSILLMTFLTSQIQAINMNMQRVSKDVAVASLQPTEATLTAISCIHCLMAPAEDSRGCQLRIWIISGKCVLSSAY